MDPFSMVVAIVAIATLGGVLRQYLKSAEKARERQAPPLPTDLDERLARMEARLAALAGEQKQLREEVDWQGKLLQRPADRSDDQGGA